MRFHRLKEKAKKIELNASLRAVLSRYQYARQNKRGGLKTPWQKEKGTGGGDGKLDATDEFDRG